MYFASTNENEDFHWSHRMFLIFHHFHGWIWWKSLFSSMNAKYMHDFVRFTKKMSFFRCFVSMGMVSWCVFRSDQIAITRSLSIFFSRHASYSDKAFQDMLRRRAEFDRQRSSGHTFYQSHQYNYFHKNYFGSLSIVLIIIGFGIFIHALQWR